MSDLKGVERLKFESLFGMKTGYVIDFSDRTFQEFILENVKMDIYDDRFNYRSGSKANRLRAFWIKESNINVSKLNSALLEYWKTVKFVENSQIAPEEEPIYQECLEINKILMKKEDSEVLTEESFSVSSKELVGLKSEFFSVENLTPQERGFAFEKFLNKLFNLFDLAPRQSFRLVGEQIDGSFQLDSNTYLVEAKWHKQPIGNSDLLAFQGKVSGKSNWARGIFISYNGFSDDGLAAFSKSCSANIIGMTGQDIHLVLDGNISLVDAINQKARRSVETGNFMVSVYQLMKEALKNKH